MSTSPDSVARTGVPGPHLVCDLIAAPRITIPGVRDRLDNGMRAIIARQGMMFVATSDGSGVCDCTFRAGPPGFVRVLDEGKLVWPEYRGNGVLASAGNITENPHVGLLFPGFIEGRPDLYVNGLADLTDDAEMRAFHPELPEDPVPGRRADLWVTVFVDEAYLAPAARPPGRPTRPGVCLPA